MVLAACSTRIGRIGRDPGSIYAEANRAYERGDLQSALALADRGFSQTQANASPQWYWTFRFLKAEILLTQGKTAQASDLLPASLPAPAASPELESRLLLDRGWADFRLANYGESRDLLDRSLQIAEAHGLTQLAARIELRRAGVFIRGFSDAAAAESDSRDALQRARQARDLYLEASALGNLGYVMMNAARYDEAIAWFNQAVSVSDRLQSKSLATRNLTNLGQCYVELGQEQKAAPLFQRAERLAAETGELTDREISLGRLGDSYRAAGQYQAALASYEQALVIARQIKDRHWVATWLDNLTAISIDMGDLARAGRYRGEWPSIQNQINDPVASLWPQLEAARIAEARQQIEVAQQGYRAVIRSAERLGTTTDPNLLLGSHERLANVLAAAHRDAEAEAEYQKALLLIETARGRIQQDTARITYFARLLSLYQEYVNFLMARNRAADALRLAESSRALVLAEKLGATQPSVGRNSKYDYRKLARASNTVLLSYWLAPEQSFLWVVTPRSIDAFRLPPESRIKYMVTAHQETIESVGDPLGDQNEISRKLSATLLGPAMRFIPPGSKVAIVPDGALHNLNFETLAAPGAQDRFWIEDATVSVVPSLDLAYRNLGAGRYNRDGALLVIGNPLTSDEKSRLPNAGAEITKIGGQFRQAVLRTGAAARPEAYRDAAPARFSMVHFAAHAEANPDDPLDSAIILSPGGDTDKLYARDVARVPIHASLVTVSACHSAGSRTYGGEGLVGFAWAFLKAGAKIVVAGLWEVDDLSTSQLMDHMYAGLRTGKSPAEALRAAKLAMLRSRGAYRKPYYWAPFQVITASLER